MSLPDISPELRLTAPDGPHCPGLVSLGNVAREILKAASARTTAVPMAASAAKTNTPCCAPTTYPLPPKPRNFAFSSVFNSVPA